MMFAVSIPSFDWSLAYFAIDWEFLEDEILHDRLRRPRAG